MNPDRVAQNYHNTDAENGKPRHPYQPPWMGHWIQQRSNYLASQVNNQDESRVMLDWDSKQAAATSSVGKGTCVTFEYKNSRRYERDLGAPFDVPQSTNEIGVVNKARRVTVTNEKLFVSSKNSNSERSELQPFPMFNFSQKMATIFAPKNDQAVWHSQTSGFRDDDSLEFRSTSLGTNEHHFPSTVLGLAPNRTDSPSKEHRSQPEPILKACGCSFVSNISLEKETLPTSRRSQEEAAGLSFNFVQHGLKLGGTPPESFVCRKKETGASSSYEQSKEHLANANFTRGIPDHNYCSYSTSVLYDNKMNKQSISRNPGSLCSGKNDSSQKLHDPSEWNLHSPISAGEQERKMNVFSGTGFPPSGTNSQGIAKLEELKHGCHSPLRLPTHSPHDPDRRTCTAVDCMDGAPRDPRKSLQTFHQLLIAKKSDVDLYMEDGMIRESAVSTESRGDALSEQGNEDVRDGKICSRGSTNESSAETDTMEIEICEKSNYFLGMASFPPNKDAMVCRNPAKSQATLASSSEKVGRRKTETKLLDLNQMPPSILTSAKPMENMDLSMSVTESFDVEHSLSADAHFENLQSNTQHNILLGLDPSCRWVKRLKLTASDSVDHGTEDMRSVDASSLEKASNLYNKDKNCIRTGKEPMVGNHLAKGHIELGKTMMLSSRGPSSVESVKERGNITLSNSWVRRWCHNLAAAPPMKPSAPVGCEQQSSKTAPNEFQTKQLPSIAAMALMGKAMTGFQACEFTNKGSLVVWNSGEG